jgi:hypothetical protein
VIWTRHRNPPDHVPTICDWFAEHAFEGQWLSEPDDTQTAVGVHRFQGQPQPLPPDTRMFTFVGYDTLHKPSDSG